MSPEWRKSLEEIKDLIRIYPLVIFNMCHAFLQRSLEPPPTHKYHQDRGASVVYIKFPMLLASSCMLMSTLAVYSSLKTSVYLVVATQTSSRQMLQSSEKETGSHRRLTELWVSGLQTPQVVLRWTCQEYSSIPLLRWHCSPRMPLGGAINEGEIRNLTSGC